MFEVDVKHDGTATAARTGTEIQTSSNLRLDLEDSGA